MYMEDSMNFSNYDRSENNDDFENDQESGWTWYLDQDNHNYNYNSSSFSSLVSDAASLVDANHQISIHNYNINTIKKKKTRGHHHHLLPDHENALEDTATSPVNSPKVSDQLNKSTKQRYHTFNINSYQEKVNMGSSCRSEDDIDDNVDLIIGRESELKKKGLCLVPLSMVLNHFG